MSRYHVPRSWLLESNNLLVIFEETGGNPLDISVKLRSDSVICAQVSETHYPPLEKWVHQDFIDGSISVKDMTPEMQLRCQDGHIISSIEFASYGTPQGSCQKFSRSNCHAPNSLSVVAKVCHLHFKPTPAWLSETNTIILILAWIGISCMIVNVVSDILKFIKIVYQGPQTVRKKTHLGLEMRGGILLLSVQFFNISVLYTLATLICWP